MSSELPLAGRFRRLVATLIDAILVPSLSLVLLMITDVMEDAEDYANVDLMLLWIFLISEFIFQKLHSFIFVVWKKI